MRYITIKFEDGTTIGTDINGTDEEIRDYYIDKYFDHSDSEGPDKMVKAVDIVFGEDTIICPHCGMGQIPPSPDRICNIKICGKKY